MTTQAEQLKMLRDTADWLKRHSWVSGSGGSGSSGGLLRRMNRTDYIVKPSSIVTHNPMRRLDSVIVLSDAITFIQMKYEHLLGNPVMDKVIPIYFTPPLGNDLKERFAAATLPKVMASQKEERALVDTPSEKFFSSFK